ncbi:Transcriptional regulatory protein YehT [Lacunisphaera limnophila]|uniref:Transcriptional regulatory protein YehT n=1 Tax=Lacunisphaera limnophila TaxID=1838286 RepID=A0A1D8AV35_9BACT|nr:LytTR family DNA-binding domain-containing protein [Lacunisphaera limnophila]AOS44743.1 Transcriptional regulatory protein YehT [Lacunisphaera limnophila]
MKIRTLIVDDEPLARDRLRGFLRAEPDVDLIGECGSGPEAVALIKAATPDLVFLDMQMPGCDGLQVIAQLPEDRRPAIIFATAHEKFAVDAFDLAAADYLLKPFDRDRFQQALRRAQDQLQRLRTPESPAAPAPRADRITVKADGRLVFLKPEEIVRVEAADNYVMLHLVAGRLMLRETMAAIETRLGTLNFARVNRSAIVHLGQIREIQPALHGDYTVVLRDGTKLPLSRSLRGRLDRFAGG